MVSNKAHVISQPRASPVLLEKPRSWTTRDILEVLNNVEIFKRRGWRRGSHCRSGARPVHVFRTSHGRHHLDLCVYSSYLSAPTGIGGFENPLQVQNSDSRCHGSKCPALKEADPERSVHRISEDATKQASLSAGGLRTRDTNDVSNLPHLYLSVWVGMCHLFDLGIQSPTPRIPLQLTPRSK